MAVATTYEATLMQPFEALFACEVDAMGRDYEARLQLLEHWSSRIGGFDYKEYCRVFGIEMVFDAHKYEQVSAKLTQLAGHVEVEPALIISALSREPLGRPQQKETGAYYTDFRLAGLIAGECSPFLTKEKSMADLASGSGALLAAVASAFKKKYPGSVEGWLMHKVFAFDVSEHALRGCRIVLSSYMSNVLNIKAMTKNWRLTDSLIGKELPYRSFDIIVGNPPWGKIKLSRHSYLMKSGNGHIYGADYDNYDQEIFDEEKKKLALYSGLVKEKYRWLKNTEPDTYIAFLERAFGAVKEGGRVLMLLPAGIIRSKGTYRLREELVHKCSDLSFTVINNRARFFSIDTRFKFLLLNCSFACGASLPDGIKLAYGDGNDRGVSVSDFVTIPLMLLREARPDLTLPEVRTPREMELYFRLYAKGCDWANDPQWASNIARELDMTNDKVLFHGKPRESSIALVEGRMVHQHSFPAKMHISGTGRAAKWEPSGGILKPQFWVDPDELPQGLRARVQKQRAGYCDIAGQTNERSMMSTIIPPGVVCGNKVPTIIFEDSQGGRRELLWVGITNSFVYDWMLRRVISTTANYFLIISVPMPDMHMDSALGVAIISSTRAIMEMQGNTVANQMELAVYRRQIDIAATCAYGIDFRDFELILEDFPLLDRKQPPINGEKKSTVTRDFLLSGAATHYGIDDNGYAERYDMARRLGAVPYIPTDILR